MKMSKDPACMCMCWTVRNTVRTHELDSLRLSKMEREGWPPNREEPMREDELRRMSKDGEVSLSLSLDTSSKATWLLLGEPHKRPSQLALFNVHQRLVDCFCFSRSFLGLFLVFYHRLKFAQWHLATTTGWLDVWTLLGVGPVATRVFAVL